MDGTIERGLAKIYSSLVGIAVCSILVELLNFASEELMIVKILVFLFAVVHLVFDVIKLMGFYDLQRVFSKCRLAFKMQVGYWIFVVLAKLFAKMITAGHYGLLEIKACLFLEICIAVAALLLPIIQIGILCFSIRGFMLENGDEEMAEQGKRAWWIYFGCLIAQIFFALFFGDTETMLGVNLWRYMVIILNILAIVVSSLVLVKFLGKSMITVSNLRWQEE